MATVSGSPVSSQTEPQIDPVVRLPFVVIGRAEMLPRIGIANDLLLSGAKDETACGQRIMRASLASSCACLEKLKAVARTLASARGSRIPQMGDFKK
jgi:hypothetical protein